MTDPADLSAAFAAAFNTRDWDSMRSMMGESISFRFPGLDEITDPDEVIDFYRRATPSMGDTRLTMAEVVSDGNRWCAFVAELSSDAMPNMAAFHEWDNDRLKTYRSFSDTRPAGLGEGTG